MDLFVRFTKGVVCSCGKVFDKDGWSLDAVEHWASYPDHSIDYYLYVYVPSMETVFLLIGGVIVLGIIIWIKISMSSSDQDKTISKLRKRLVKLEKLNKTKESTNPIQETADPIKVSETPIALMSFEEATMSDEEDKEKIKNLKSRARNIENRAIIKLSSAYIYGEGVIKDVRRGFVILERANTVRSASLWLEAGYYFKTEGKEDSIPLAKKCFAKAAKIEYSGIAEIELKRLEIITESESDE